MFESSVTTSIVEKVHLTIYQTLILQKRIRRICKILSWGSDDQEKVHGSVQRCTWGTKWFLGGITLQENLLKSLFWEAVGSVGACNFSRSLGTGVKNKNKNYYEQWSQPRWVCTVQEHLRIYSKPFWRKEWIIQSSVPRMTHPP